MPCIFSTDWSAKVNLRAFNHGTSPILQLLSENILATWSASTKILSITRGSLYYSNLYASTCTSGSNTSTTMKIHQVVITNITN